MINIILNGFLPMKNKLNFIKSSNLFTLLFQSIPCIILLLSLNSFAQPPIDITKDKVKQPQITQPPLPIKEPKTQPIPVKKNREPVKTPLITQQPRQTLPQGVKEITIFPFENNTQIKFQYTGSVEIEDLGDTAIVGMQLSPNTEYVLQVKIEKYLHPQYNVETERFVLYKQIKPAPVIENNIPNNNPDNYNKELFVYELPNGKVIQTKNIILFIGQWIEDDGSINIKFLDEANFRRFYNNIYRFTFYEGATYILEVVKEGEDFTLINILSETPTSVSKPTIKQYPAFPSDITKKILTKETIKYNNITTRSVSESENIKDKSTKNYYPVFTSNTLENAIWHLRYLYEADGVLPYNFIEEDAELKFNISFDKFLNKANGSSPCTNFECVLLTNELDKFDCYNTIITEQRCANSKIQQLFFNQLQTVNKYDIIDNKLRLFKDSKMLLLFEGFTIKKQ